MDGFFIINKEKGITSFGVCNRIKHTFNEKHVGHTGTLDPDTTGVLVVGVGKACKMMPYLNEHDKSYRATILLGKASDTLDISGNITDDIKTNIANDEILSAIDELSRRESQVPPMYSAIKVNGVKMYDLARKGESVELEPRHIKVYSYNVSRIYDIDGYQAIDISLDVSKGFYVRSYARDLGLILNVPSLMYSLERSKAGEYSIDKAIKLADISSDTLISIDDMFDFYKYEANDYIARLVKNGVTLDERQLRINEPFKIYSNNKLIAIYEPVSEYKYKPVVIL